MSARRRWLLGPSRADRGDGRAIGPLGTAVRVLAGVLALAVAALWQGLGWWDVAAASIAFPLVALSAWWLLSPRGPNQWPGSATPRDGPGYAASLLAVAIAAALTFVTPADQPAVWAWLGGSLLLAAARGDGGREALAVANALGGRREHGGCVLFTPLDAAEGRRRRSAIRRRAPVRAELPLTTAVITDPDGRLLGVVRTADPPAELTGPSERLGHLTRSHPFEHKS